MPSGSLRYNSLAPGSQGQAPALPPPSGDRTPCRAQPQVSRNRDLSPVSDVLLRRWGGDASIRTPSISALYVNRQIVLAACALHHCDVVDTKCLLGLSHVHEELKRISGINREDWDALKLVTAMKVVVFPEEEIDFPELFAQDELSEMKADAPKYKDIVPAACCKSIYRKVISSHHLRIEKKELLRSLVKEAEGEREAEHGEVYEKGKRQGKRQGESEQILQQLQNAPCKRPKMRCITVLRR